MLTQSCDRGNPIYNYPSWLSKAPQKKTLHFTEIMLRSFSMALSLNDSSSKKEMKESSACLTQT